MTLDQLMAFTVNADHERQEQVWERLQRSYAKEPYQIRRLLTEGAVRASDKRAQFVGVAAYEGAGGDVKARILQAVREAKGDGQAQLIGHLKKGEMAEKAQELLADLGWLPEPLRTRGHDLAVATGEAEIAR